MKPADYQFKYLSLAEALYEALTEDAFYTTMENSVLGDMDMRRQAMLRYYDFSLQEGRKYGDIYALDGQAVGASIWAKPVNGNASEQMAEEKKVFLQGHMGDASLLAYTQITASMGRHTATVIRPGSWYLSILGIAPPFQSQGLGKTLVQPMLERTDAFGRHTYLETFTPRNMPFYQRLGFQDAGGFDEPITGARYWVMSREPQ